MNVVERTNPSGRMGKLEKTGEEAKREEGRGEQGKLERRRG